MPIQRQSLDELEFIHTHDVVIDGDMPSFQQVFEPAAAASVYMWVSPTELPGEFDVLYVGKAGFGVPRRLRQHRGGFVNSGVGRKNRALIAEWIEKGRRVMVFARVAAIHQVFGTEVSLYSTEEHALCDRFLPRWNRASFPRAADANAVLPAGAQARPVAPQQRDLPAFNEVADGDEIAAFYGALSADKQAQFAQLFALLEQRDPAAGHKVVAGYSGQPRGYNGKPMLAFGRIGRGGRAMNAVGRIPLVDSDECPLTVVLMDSARLADLDADKFCAGSSGSWRPLDLANFLQSPQAYLR